MNILSEMYSVLHGDVKGRKLKFPHTTVFLTKFALEAKFGRPFDLEYVRKIMYEEGFGPWEDYGVPKWYHKKWYPEPDGTDTPIPASADPVVEVVPSSANSVVPAL